MHKHNIVHRDLKLENIVYSQMDTHGSIIDFSKVVLKLIDFGFSTTSVLGKTDLKGLTGTAYFMAPEIITN
jgi:serine/threonine protein kinase